jgi:hypothetical protein
LKKLIFLFLLTCWSTFGVELIFRGSIELTIKEKERLKHLAELAYDIKNQYRESKKVKPFELPQELYIYICKDFKELARAASIMDMYNEGFRALGAYDFTNRIWLVKDDDIFNTFVHELGHLVLYTGNEIWAEDFISYLKNKENLLKKLVEETEKLKKLSNKLADEKDQIKAQKEIDKQNKKLDELKKKYKEK